MLRHLTLYDFMEYPNLAIKIAMASPYKWNGAPEIRCDSKLINVTKNFFFFLGVLNLLYQITGSILFLFVEQGLRSVAQNNLEILGHISETGAIMALVLVCICKMWMIYSNKNSIQSLLQELEQIFPNPKQSKEYKLYQVEQFAKQSQQLMKRLMIFFIFAYIYYNSLPFFELAYELIMPDQQFKYRFQSNTWYPWQTINNKKSIISFVACYICQVLSSTCGVAFLMSGEFLLCFFITQMKMHLEYLAYALENCDATAPNANQRLKKLLNYHSRLLRHANDINGIFTKSFFVNFITAAIAICLMALSMVLLSFLHALKYSLGLIVFLIFTFFICYNGQEFTETSNKLSPAAFYSNWYEGNREYRQMMLFLIMRAKEPNYLRAYKLSTVSMETFMQILKISYRLFTFVKAMG